MTSEYNIEVRLLAITGLVNNILDKPAGTKGSDSEHLIEYAGRLCWDTAEKLGTDSDRIQEWINVGHESVIEHASASFFIRASRAFTHELVRHRIASYSQRSQRYVSESEPKYIKPPEIAEISGEHGEQIYEDAMKACWSAYNQLVAQGVKKEIARYILPNACETQIVMSMNFRELRHFIKLRTSSRALPEMRAVADEIRRIMKAEAPKVFNDL